MDMVLSSSAFAHNGSIPKLYTCQGEDVSPPLAWGNVPAGAKSLVLIVDDPDAPLRGQLGGQREARLTVKHVQNWGRLSGIECLRRPDRDAPWATAGG